MLNNKTILCIIPARGGSKGIKLKNIQKINGVPLIGYIKPIIDDLDIIDKAIVSTDNQKIADIALSLGLEVPFFRPNDLSGDSVPDLYVLRHALEEMEKISNKLYDIILMLQPTSPLRKSKHVRDAIQKLIDGNFDSVMTVTETDSKAHPLKQLIIEKDKLTNYDNKAKEIITRQELNKLYHRNGVAYVFSRDCLLNQDTLINMGKNASAIIIDEPTVNIDTKMDLELASYLLGKY